MGSIPYNTIGESWLVATMTDSSVPASSGPLHWSVRGKMGNDLEIDPDNATKIRINTTGFYALAMDYLVVQSADADGNFQFDLSYTGSSAFIDAATDEAEIEVRPSAGSGGAQLGIEGNAFSYPRVLLEAGQEISIDWNSNLHAGSLTALQIGQQLRIVRVP
jgi:hypothetical protein